MLNDSENFTLQQKVELKDQLEKIEESIKKKIRTAIAASSPGTVLIIWDLAINKSTGKPEVQIEVSYMDTEELSGGTTRTIFRKVS